MSRDTYELVREHTRKIAAIGVALSAEKDVEKILDMIIGEAMDFTNADGVTLYLVDPDKDVLRFAFVHNRPLGTKLGGKSASIAWPPVPLTKDGSPNISNVSAYSVITRESVNIPDVYEVENFDFSGTREYDRKNNYRCKSMLVVPMKDHEGKVIGVLQLINAQVEDGKAPVAFTPDQQEIVESLASQAAVALNNARLVRDLEALLDSLVTVIGTAIDEKSPSTGGHVRRVAKLAMDIARAINESKEGRFADVCFDEDQLKEIWIAAWLHDLGKIGTPGWLLDKSTKLSRVTDRSELIRLRYEIAKLNVQLEAIRSEPGCPRAAVEKSQQKKLMELDEEREFVLRWNDPERSPDDETISRLKKIAWEKGTLTDDELKNLCIRKGTLTPEERQIIENHVIVTERMLKKLRLPKSLAGVPSYAGGHHEMLDGHGYPKGLKRDEIPLQTRILAIADIFEALSAERPYKKPVSFQKTLSILKSLADEGKLDVDVIQTAIKGGVFASYVKRDLK